MTQEISLREVRESDIDTLFQMEIDPESNRIAVATPRSAASFAATWSRHLGDPTVVARVILLGDEVVGYVTRFKLDGLDSVGYWVARAHWGKGIATRALSQLLRQHPLRPLHARAASTNIASIRVLEKCGFRVTKREWAPATDRFPACEETWLTLR